MKYNPDQALLPLTQTVTEPRRTSLVCIPDLDSAQVARTRMQHEFGPRLIKADIRKDRAPKRNPNAKRTYTLAYTVLETKTRNLF